MADAKKEEPTKPTPEEKLAAAEAEVDALVKKGDRKSTRLNSSHT